VEDAAVEAAEEEAAADAEDNKRPRDKR